MKKTDETFEKYSQFAVHFFDAKIPALLREATESLPDGFHVVDLGCGDGAMVYVLKSNDLLERADSVVGVDLSPLRVDRFQEITGFPAFVQDVQNLPSIADDTVDLVINAMNVEHVPDDLKLLCEIKRILSPRGAAYVTTIFRGRFAWYFRRSPDGRWVLDPTHVREYGSREEVLDLFCRAGLSTERVIVSRLAFPIIHPIVRIIHAILPIPGVNRLFFKNRVWRRIERIKLPIPNYWKIEILARKISATSNEEPN